MVADEGGRGMKAAWDYHLFADGYCLQLEGFSIKGGRWHVIRFPSMMALLQHPRHGAILFDTGYSERFPAATKSFPNALYRWLTPVTVDPKMTAPAYLARRGLNADALSLVVLSHFHADHMGALHDFPNAVFSCSRRGLESIEGKSSLSGLRHAFLPELMPPGFRSRAEFVEDKPQVTLADHWRPFENGRDLLGDGSLVAVDLPGHAIGQFGLAFDGREGRPVFLVADSCWSRRAYRENLTPSLLGWIPQADRSAYVETLQKLHELHCRSPEIRIVPTHCDEGEGE